MSYTIEQLESVMAAAFERGQAIGASEIAQLRGTLSLAEEGLANYAQEAKGAQHDIEQLMAAASAEANEVERLRALLREVYNHGENGDLHKKIGAVFGVEPGEDIPAVPQSGSTK